MALAGDHVQVLVDGYELTGDSHQMAFNDSRDLLEKTVFGDVAHNFLPGQVLSRLVHRGFLNAEAARSHPVLRGVTIDARRQHTAHGIAALSSSGWYRRMASRKFAPNRHSRCRFK